MYTERESMLQLAARAFRSHNFDLAADIYAHQLGGAGDAGGRLELLLKRADALAFGGRMSEAFAAYREAAAVERLGAAHLERLTDHLSELISRQRGARTGGVSARTGDGREDVSCGMCLSFLFEPVTLPCGHCFCKRCLERDRGEGGRPGRCRECRDSSRVADVQSYRVNVVLSNLLAKWFPLLHQAARLRREGNALYAERRTEAALDKYNQAILIAPSDHILFSNRSQILSSLQQHQQALSDADTACRLMPLWSKGHVRRAQALASLGRTEEALREFLVCLSIEPDCKQARSEAHRLLSDFLAPLTDAVPERLTDCSILSSRLHVKDSVGLQTLSPSLSSASALVLPTIGGSDGGRCVEQSLLLKRKRRVSEEEEEHQKKPKADPSGGPVVGGLLDPADLECSLCMRLFHEPVTTPCGHSFCLQCLERCLDHSPKCPLCKEGLSEYLVQRRYCKTVLMEKLISKYLPSELTERQKIHQEEMAELSNLNQNVPIFVCTMAFPTVPCPLHIFEPCYRLMIRRCMETGTNCFGMCLGDELKGFADYGCLLEIRDVQFFSDGRSVVDTIGRRRFKVVQHSQRDGYNTADIEYLEDVKVEGVAKRELQSLHDTVYEQALVWVNSLRTEQKDRIEGHFGPMPGKDAEFQASPNGPSWCWWLLAVLPLEGRAQLPFLALTSLRDRLSGIRKVLLFMAQSRHR